LIFSQTETRACQKRSVKEVWLRHNEETSLILN
jgi:hypothetical protein